MFWNATNAWKDRVPTSQFLSLKDPPREFRKQPWIPINTFPKRPSTAGGLQKTSRKKSVCLSDSKLGLNARPSTAPALLTGEGLIVQKTHEDLFLHKLENKQVKKMIDHQRKEVMTQKVWEVEYDLPANPVTEGSRLYEVNLFHGNAQRLRCSRLSKSKSSPTNTIDQLHELSQTLDGNVRQHCYRIGMPRAQNTDVNRATLSKSRSKHFGMSGGAEAIVKDTVQHSRASVQLGAELGELFRTKTVKQFTRSSLARQGTHGTSLSLLRLAGIMQEKYGNFRTAFQTIATSDGLLSLGDWEKFVEQALPDAEAVDLFRHLRLNDNDRIAMEEFEEVFNTQIRVPSSQNPADRR